MQILDGKALSDRIKIELKQESILLNEKGIFPALA